MLIIKKYKPTSPGRRGYVSVIESNLYKGKPFPSLVISKKNTAGRNNKGRITSWHRGGGHKKKYRIIDWKRNDKNDILGNVERIEYDPNRSSYIALILYTDGERRYIIAPKNLKVGNSIRSGVSTPIKTGNNLPLAYIPLGTFVHCIELRPGKGAQLARSAGCSAQILAIDKKHVTLRLRSGEMRKVLAKCTATIGEVCKSEHNLQKFGKAGRNRWKGKRPRVRGVAMNPVDHPLGGGEGRTSGGRPPCTPWGIPDGKRTRVSKKAGSKLIVRKRNSNIEK